MTDLRRWLRRQPHPVKLRVDGRDVAIAQGPKMWVVTEDTVKAMNPSRVEAIGPDGVCLRALILDGGDDDDGESKAETQRRVELESADARLLEMSRLLAEAHDAGARRHAEAYALAFDKMTGLVEILATRLGGLENAWQSAMKANARAQADAIAAAAAAEAAAHGDNDPASTAIATMLAQGLMAQARGAPANGTNGAPKPKAPTNGKESK